MKGILFKMKNKIKNAIIIIISFILILNIQMISVEASNVKEKLSEGIKNNNEIDVNSEEEVKETIINIMSTINSEGINNSLLKETTNLYEQISEKYTNDEIANIIKENQEVLEKNGIKAENINVAVNILNSISTSQTKKILNTVDIDALGKKIESGATVQEVLNEVVSNLSTKEKVDLVMEMMGSVKIIKNIFIIFVVIFVYRTLLRCVIYKKAGKRAWAPFIPIYRNVVMLKVCQMSPWWLLLLLVPIVGWIILWIVSVASKFMLSEKFGKGVGFSFGLWLLPVVFESILALSKKTKYIE